MILSLHDDADEPQQSQEQQHTQAHDTNTTNNNSKSKSTSVCLIQPNPNDNSSDLEEAEDCTTAAAATSSSCAITTTTTTKKPIVSAPLHSVSAFLNTFRVEKGCDHTHTSFQKPSGSFYLPSAQLDTFFKVYKAAVERGDENLHITERHRHIGPIVIDIDFRYDYDINDIANGPHPVRRHTPEDIRRIISIYIKNLAYYCFLPERIEAYVTEKPHPTINEKQSIVKDGAHIILPDIVTRPAVQQLVRKDSLFEIEIYIKSRNLKPANRVDDIVDAAVIDRNNWMMYGSRKPNLQPYKVTQKFVWNASDKKVVSEELDPDVPQTAYVERFSIRNKYDETRTRHERLDDVDSYVRISEECKRRKEAVDAVLRDDRGNGGDAGSPSRNNTCDNLDMVLRLVACLSPERATSYNDWIRAGWCFRNIDHRLMDAWIDLSKKSNKYVDGECQRLWASMRQGRLGIGTLHLWARQDSPVAYAEIMRSDLTSLIIKCVTSGHYDVAAVVHHLYKYQYVCSSMKNKTWYEFRDHRWRESDCAVTLRKHISEDVWIEFNTVAQQTSQRAASCHDEMEKDNLAKLANRILSVALKLRQTSFKENVMKECAEMFYQEGFESKLDSDIYLVGFENGIYDLSRGEFRDGHPDDYVSFSTGNNYIPYDNDSPIAKEIQTFWSQVHPDLEIREYVLKTIASCLCGHIREERFHIWTGSGCHAKGTEIMMYDGSSRLVEDVAVGDLLMGDDSTPRTVQQLFRGHADMWRVVPIKGEPFVVNGDHVLSLKTTHSVIVSKNSKSEKRPWKVTWLEWDDDRLALNRIKDFETKEDAEAFRTEKGMNQDVVKSGDVVDITVKKYLTNVRRIGERYFNLYRPDFVEFPERPTNSALDPYILGVWLGDGTSQQPEFTNMDQEVMDAVAERLPSTVSMNMMKNRRKGRAETYYLSKASHVNGKTNDLRSALRSYKLLGKGLKHIPLDYRCGSKETRMQVLAGLIDIDGSYQKHTNQFTICQKNERLMDDIVSMVRSLGFACYKKQIQSKCCNNGKVGTYYECNIVGDGIEDIPTRIPRKKARGRVKNKDVRRVGFKLERVEDGDFYGFELDNNHRYLMTDFSVQHNSNSKSKCATLIEKTLGQYCCKFPVTMLTQKRAASGSATPEIARAKGKRFGVLQEPSEDEKLNVGLMKELSGGDVIQTRELFKAPVEWKPQFHLFLLCNHLPNVPSDDGGTWRRIRVVEFGSKFVEHPNPDAPNEFQIDYSIDNKLEIWRETFLGMLVDVYYKAYANNKLYEPLAVTQCTRDYQKNSDSLADFVDTQFERQPPPPPPRQGDILPIVEQPRPVWTTSIEEAWEVYKKWRIDEVIPGKPKKNEMKAYLDRSFGKGTTIKGKFLWKGVRLRGNDMFEEDDNSDDCF